MCQDRASLCDKYIIFDNNTLWSKRVEITIFTNKNTLIIQDSYPPFLPAKVFELALSLEVFEDVEKGSEQIA